MTPLQLTLRVAFYCFVLLLVCLNQIYAQRAILSVPAHYTGRTHIFSFSQPNDKEQFVLALDRKNVHLYKVNANKKILEDQTTVSNVTMQMDDWTFRPLAELKNDKGCFILHTKEGVVGEQLIVSWFSRDFKAMSAQKYDMGTGEQIVQALSGEQAMFLLTSNSSGSTLTLRVFKSQEQPQIIKFDVLQKVLRNILAKPRQHYFSEVPRLFQPRLDHTYSSTKCYLRQDRLLLTVEQAEATHIYTLPLTPESSINEQIIKHTLPSKQGNSFWDNDTLYCINWLNKKLTIKVIDLKTEKEIKSMSHELANFPRSSIAVQEGALLSPYRHLYLDNNKKIAQKLKKGRLALSIVPQANYLRFTVGSYRRFKGNGGIVLVPEHTGGYIQTPARMGGLAGGLNNLLHFGNTGDQERVFYFYSLLKAKDLSSVPITESMPTDNEEIASYLQSTNLKSRAAMTHWQGSYALWQYEKTGRMLILSEF